MPEDNSALQEYIRSPRGPLRVRESQDTLRKIFEEPPFWVCYQPHYLLKLHFFSIRDFSSKKA